MHLDSYVQCAGVDEVIEEKLVSSSDLITEMLTERCIKVTFRGKSLCRCLCVSGTRYIL